ncbi:MAG: Holliday junction resolvase RuvX [Pseudomonadota bacterium]
MQFFSENISEFSQILAKGTRLLGFDVGEKTIGLALSDVYRIIATPYKTIMRGKFTKDALEIANIVAEHKISGFVIGYPINMDGSIGERCQSIRQFARNLNAKIDMPILFADERMSTMAVTTTMLEADLSRKRRAEIVDKLAASYILQGTLDRLKNVL